MQGVRDSGSEDPTGRHELANPLLWRRRRRQRSDGGEAVFMAARQTDRDTARIAVAAVATCGDPRPPVGIRGRRHHRRDPPRDRRLDVLVDAATGFVPPPPPAPGGGGGLGIQILVY